MSILDRPATFWSVALLIAILFGLTNLPWTLDDYDQAKQAFTSFEMVQEGHWLYQYTPNERIATKPPLVGWISAAVFAVTRSWDLAWRLPSFAAAAALALVLTRAAREAYGVTAGLLALSAFGLNLLSPRLATLVRTDMPLALVTFLIGLVIWRKVRNAEPWSGRERTLLFALLTAAMLIKGPIIYAFLLPGIVAMAWWKRANVWSGWWPWIASLGVFAIWVLGGISIVPGFYEQVVLREFAGRFGETVHRPQPFYFYLPHLLHKFAPWSLLLVGLAIVARRARTRLTPDVLWLVCWSLGGLVVMSLIPSKRVDRIFPVAPPLCLLLASFAPRLTSGVRRWCGLALLFAGVFTSGYAAERVVSSYRADDAALVRFGAEVRGRIGPGRYQVVGGQEEGLLLYLRKPHFIKADAAIERWNSGALDGLVVPAGEAPLFLAKLQGAKASDVEAFVTINKERREYVLLVRSAP